jgi:hypothetical protein
VTRTLVGSRRAEATALPDWVKPQLTKLVDQPPEGPEWLHEIKFDGYRMHARVDRSALRLLTRTGLDWTHKYPAIAAALAKLPSRQAYLDGELCGARPDGTTSFSLIQNALDTGNSGALVFSCFRVCKTPSALSCTMIGARLGDRGSHHSAKRQYSGFMQVESRARRQVPRRIAAPRCTRAGDGGGAAATSLHRALRL